MKKPKNSHVIIEIKLSHGCRKFFKKTLPESSLMVNPESAIVAGKDLQGIDESLMVELFLELTYN